MFSRNVVNRPESKTTRMFRPVRQVAAPGTKSAVSDCMLIPIVGISTLSSVKWFDWETGRASALYAKRI